MNKSILRKHGNVASVKEKAGPVLLHLAGFRASGYPAVFGYKGYPVALMAETRCS